MRFRKYLLGITLLAAVCAVVFIFYGRAVVYIFAKTNNMEIAYTQLKATRMNEFLFDGLTVRDRKSGMGIFAESARVDFSLKSADPRRIATAFDLKTVNFLTGQQEKAPSYNNIDGLVAAPFNSALHYQSISGKIYRESDCVRIEDVMARSDQLKMRVSGTLKDTSRISSDITIYFADSLTGTIPSEYLLMVLKSDEPGWKSLTVRLEGDFAKPSIQVSGKLFRLNIGVKD